MHWFHNQHPTIIVERWRHNPSEVTEFLPRALSGAFKENSLSPACINPINRQNAGHGPWGWHKAPGRKDTKGRGGLSAIQELVPADQKLRKKYLLITQGIVIKQRNREDDSQAACLWDQASSTIMSSRRQGSPDPTGKQLPALGKCPHAGTWVNMARVLIIK